MKEEEMLVSVCREAQCRDDARPLSLCLVHCNIEGASISQNSNVVHAVLCSKEVATRHLHDLKASASQHFIHDLMQSVDVDPAKAPLTAN